MLIPRESRPYSRLCGAQLFNCLLHRVHVGFSYCIFHMFNPAIIPSPSSLSTGHESV